MIEDFKRFISREDLFKGSDRILLAVSGGIDSVVMAKLFCQAGFHFAIAHANFQLRGKESERDEAFVRKLAEEFNVKIFVKHFETNAYSRSEKLSVQVAARQLRYKWFEELLPENGFDYIATAHHLDDQVETFLINLTRGTGIAGLHGILPKQGKLIRPMLFAYRAQIEVFARENNLEFVEDSSNLEDKYLRNRLRHKVIPEMERITPGFSRELNHTIGLIRDAEAIYRQTIDLKKREILTEKDDQIFINAELFFSLKPLAGWAYELLSPYGFNQSNVFDIIGLANAIPGKEIRSSTFRLIKDREHLIIIPLYNEDERSQILITENDLLNRNVRLPVHLRFEILKKKPASVIGPETIAYIDLDKIEFPLELRKWERGDYFFPLGMANPKKLSDFFTDRKFSRIGKERTWLLCSNRRIVWIVGHRLDDRFKLFPDSKRILKITFYPESKSPEPVL